jgi:potassium-transporting ATPase KdpC subunit
MERQMRELIKPAAVLFLAFTLLTGVAYPLLVTGIAQAVFPSQANGSLVADNGLPAKGAQDAFGSRLIGQPFSAPGYFWSRPSATSPFPYNAAASSGSNLGPLNPALNQAVHQRVQTLKSFTVITDVPVPVDLLTASGSGLDPHISPAAAQYQVPRVATARGMDMHRVQELVQRYTEGRTMGVLGEPRVNVLLLNLALDRRGPLTPAQEVKP